jgi:hypothetical protein
MMWLSERQHRTVGVAVALSAVSMVGIVSYVVAAIATGGVL